MPLYWPRQRNLRTSTRFLPQYLCVVCLFCTIFAAVDGWSGNAHTQIMPINIITREHSLHIWNSRVAALQLVTGGNAVLKCKKQLIYQLHCYFMVMKWKFVILRLEHKLQIQKNKTQNLTYLDQINSCSKSPIYVREMALQIERT